MKINVLAVKTTRSGLRIAHVQLGEMYGDILATDDVTGPGEYWLKVTLRVKDGRLIALVRAEKCPA